jgi:hypothetical protein
MGQYLLKPGVLLQAFGDESKTCTADNLTDELAIWHLTQCPEKAKYFARMPGMRTAAPADIKIVPPVIHETVIVPPEVKIIPAVDDPVIIPGEKKTRKTRK